MNDDADRALLNEASTVLWRERQLLDLLLFKLEEEQLLLAAGRDRWLHHATREVEMILGQIRTVELSRALKIEQLSAAFGLGPSPTLRAVVDALPDPWNEIFAKHRAALLEVTEEIRQLADTNREMLAKGQRVAREALAWLTGNSLEPSSYTAAGSVAHDHQAHHLLNRAL